MEFTHMGNFIMVLNFEPKYFPSILLLFQIFQKEQFITSILKLHFMQAEIG